MTQQPELLPRGPVEAGGDLDNWETPLSAIEPILPLVAKQTANSRVLVVDPGCGTGNILEAAVTLQPRALYGFELHQGRGAAASKRLRHLADVRCRDFLEPGVIEFVRSRSVESECPVCVLGNPPYTKPRDTIGLEFWEQSLRCAAPDGLVAMLLPLDFATGVDRCKRIHDRHRTALYPLRRRPKFGNNATGQRPVAWFVTDLAEPYSEYRVIG